MQTLTPEPGPPGSPSHEPTLLAAPPVPQPVPQATVAVPVPASAELDHPALLFDRDLGWLDFNWRVLHQARDPRTPLLERVRFVAIAAGNLDEFFQKEMGEMRHTDGAEGGRLSLVRGAASELADAIVRTWEAELKPRLRAEAGVTIADHAELSHSQRAALDRHFREQIYPVLTPLAVDPGHPFPFISNLSLSLAVLLRHPERDTLHFARIKAPTGTERWMTVPVDPAAADDAPRLVLLPTEQLIGACAGELFPGMEVLGVHPFRVTRSADADREDDDEDAGGGDLLATMAEELRERRFAPVVRLEIAADAPLYVRQMLARELELAEGDVYPLHGALALGDCMEIANLDFAEHRWPAWEPVTPDVLMHGGDSREEQNLFAVLRRGDVLLHHPYDSFAASVQRLIEEAADDPQVVAIKQTLYRTSQDSPSIHALRRAAERGKQVAVLVELSARFDEANNIEWAERLEDAGVHVAYGLVGLKTHAKVALVVRREGDQIRTYGHIGTGNYHPRTARLYTDFGLMTADPGVGADLVKLFHFLTGYAPDQQYEKLVVAPRDMRATFEARIRRETEIAEGGGRARILAKMNALDDQGIIRALYRASQAGVPVDLVVRGHCRLRPGLPGFSDNIRVVSLIGRFLEHDRIYYFENGGTPEVLIGSADWRRRNLDSRVESLVRISDPDLQRRLVWVLWSALHDNRLAWELDASGRYTQRRAAPGEPEIDLQEILMRDARGRSAAR